MPESTIPLLAGFGLLMTGAITAWQEPSDGRAALETQADCLWYVARNHGFYSIQARVVGAETFPSSSVDLDALWRDFVATTGRDECEIESMSLAPLAKAVRARQPEAERLLGGDPVPPGDEAESAVTLARQVGRAR